MSFNAMKIHFVSSYVGSKFIYIHKERPCTHIYMSRQVTFTFLLSRFILLMSLT